MVDVQIMARRATLSFVAAVAATALMPVHAQPLDSLVRRAVEAHPSVRAVRLAVQEADARARSVETWEPPRVGVEFSMLPPAAIDPFAAGETRVMAEQAVPLFGRNSAMAEAAQREGDAMNAELGRVQRELRARVEREYYGLWLLDRRAELLAENRRYEEVNYKTAETRYTTGRGAQSDLFRLTIEIELLANESREIDEERSERLARLNLLTARPLAAAVVLEHSLPSRTIPPFDSLEALLGEHPGVRKVEAMAAASNAYADAADAMLRPMLMLRGGITYMPGGHPVREGNFSVTAGELARGGTPDVMHIGLMAGAMMSLPLVPWAGNGPAGQAEAYRLEAAQRLLDRDAERQDLTAALRSACALARRAELRMRFYTDTQLPLLDRARTSAATDFANGLVPISSVIDTHHMRTLAYLDLYARQVEYATAWSTITELTGVTP